MDVDTLAIFLEHQGFSIESTDDFLEHFGKAGMKWGVRTTEPSQSSGSGQGYVGAKTRRKAGLKLLGGAAGVALIGAGTLYGAKFIIEKGHIPLANVNVTGQRMQDGSFMAKSIMRQIGSKRMSDLHMPTMNEMKYSPRWFRVNQGIEALVEATR
jgi:hypothetical protein